jgi:uncharacterized membrane protein YhhN
MFYTIALTAAAVFALLTAERERARDRPAPVVWVFKPLASLGFLLTALAAGATHSTFGLMMLTALACGALGDVLLIPRDNENAFRLGMGAFLVGHLFYVAAFLRLGIAPMGALLGMFAMTGTSIAVLRWLWPQVQGVMRPLLAAYVAVFSIMAAAAAGASSHGDTALFASAAALFVVADIGTARQRFVRRAFVNKVIALPLYYAAQLLFAVSAGS